MPPAFHVLDPLVDVVGAWPDLVEGGRLDPVLLLGPPATALSPMLGMIDPPKVQTSEPSFCLMILGARSGSVRDVLVEQGGWLD